MNIIVCLGALALVLTNVQWFHDLTAELSRLERQARSNPW